ncbi:MAG TPA: GAF domain-containing protein [Polyangiaceae bacterium]
MESADFDKLRDQLVTSIAKSAGSRFFSARVLWTRLRLAIRSPGAWLRFAFLTGAVVYFGTSVWSRSKPAGIAHALLFYLLAYGRASSFVAFSHMKVVSKDYVERKIRLYALIKQVQYREGMSVQATGQYQCECLRLIASYVRNHRADWAGDEIYVNLLIEDGDDLVVVARDREHRIAGARYPKKKMVVWKAIQTGTTLAENDIGKAVAQTEEKTYRSILAIPVRGKAGEVLGAVSVDSRHPHHFEGQVLALEKYLLPYVCLLAWTIDNTGTRIGEQ